MYGATAAAVASPRRARSVTVSGPAPSAQRWSAAHPADGSGDAVTRRANNLHSAVQNIVPMVHRARKAAEAEAGEFVLQHLRAAEDEADKVLWQNELLHRQQLRTAAEVDRLAGLVRQLTAKLRSRTREAEALSAKVAVYEDDVQHAVNTAMVAIRGHVERELTAEFEAAYQAKHAQLLRERDALALRCTELSKEAELQRERAARFSRAASARGVGHKATPQPRPPSHPGHSPTARRAMAHFGGSNGYKGMPRCRVVRGEESHCRSADGEAEFTIVAAAPRRRDTPRPQSAGASVSSARAFPRSASLSLQPLRTVVEDAAATSRGLLAGRGGVERGRTGQAAGPAYSRRTSASSGPALGGAHGRVQVRFVQAGPGADADALGSGLASVDADTSRAALLAEIAGSYSAAQGLASGGGGSPYAGAMPRRKYLSAPGGGPARPVSPQDRFPSRDGSGLLQSPRRPRSATAASPEAGRAQRGGLQVLSISGTPAAASPPPSPGKPRHAEL
eukprot:jgi/Tetstr1/464413/TSEL_009205.t1